MINRILIRIKVVQMLYSYLLSMNSVSQKEAKNELLKSLDKGYELYYYLLLLMVQLTDLHAERLDRADAVDDLLGYGGQVAAQARLAGEVA